MVSSEVGEIHVVRAHCVEHAFARARSARRKKPAVCASHDPFEFVIQTSESSSEAPLKPGPSDPSSP
jgi:hypothetical protein